MKVREAALQQCIRVQEEQRKLAHILRGSKLYDLAAAQTHGTHAIETMLIPDERAKVKRQ